MTVYSAWHRLLSLLLFAITAAAQRCDQLRDHPLPGSAAVQLLDGRWAAHNAHSGLTINASVPGDIISDLQTAGVIPDVYFNVSWREPRYVSQWANGTWSFERTFSYDAAVPTTAPAGAPNTTLLVFDGVKMGAVITLNDVPLGVVTDQFLRYSFPVGGLIKPTGNTLRLTFDPAIDTGGRFMACTGGYDWAPFSTTGKTSPAVLDTLRSGWFGGGWQATFSLGIWKSLYLTTVRHSVAFTAVSAQTYYLGAYPVAPLTDSTHGGFELRVKLELMAAAALPQVCPSLMTPFSLSLSLSVVLLASWLCLPRLPDSLTRTWLPVHIIPSLTMQGGTLRLNASFGTVESKIASVPAGASEAQITLPAKQVRTLL